MAGCICFREFHRCDEVAVLMELSAQRPAAQETPQAAGAWATLLKWEEWQPLRLAYRQSSQKGTKRKERMAPEALLVLQNGAYTGLAFRHRHNR